MNVWVTSVLAMALVVFAACNSHPQRMMATDPPHERAASVVNTVTIEGPTEAVFDLVTTARFWPQWHPATTGVSGVTQRPYRLGDRINERGRIGKGDFDVVWKVAEYVRPRRVVLQSERSPVQISYSFNSRGAGTEFTRELRYRVADLKTIASDPNEVIRLMRVQSEQAVNQLKELVEKILREEEVKTE
jgi:uncharacterized protein YndB with AHSA1/START domain